MLNAHPEVNDELTIVMLSAHNGLGKILVALYSAIEVITERISIHGNGSGLDKQLMAKWEEDGEVDLGDDQMEEEVEEYQDDEGEEYRDEWELGDDPEKGVA